MSALEEIADLLHPFTLRVSVKWCGDTEPSEWDWPLFSPVRGYLETGRLGPVAVRDIDWIEVESIERHHNGRLVPDKVVDHSETISSLLKEAGYHFTLEGHVFRVTAG